mgnify:CR=1 FL=1
MFPWKPARGLTARTVPWGSTVPSPTSTVARWIVIGVSGNGLVVYCVRSTFTVDPASAMICASEVWMSGRVEATTSIGTFALTAAPDPSSTLSVSEPAVPDFVPAAALTRSCVSEEWVTVIPEGMSDTR